MQRTMASTLWSLERNKNIKKLIKKKMVKGIDKQPTGDEDGMYCKSCIAVKQTRKPFIEGVGRSSRVLELIHTDV